MGEVTVGINERIGVLNSDTLDMAGRFRSLNQIIRIMGLTLTRCRGPCPDKRVLRNSTELIDQAESVVRLRRDQRCQTADLFPEEAGEQQNGHHLPEIARVCTYPG
jgi:hypothetical protein